MIEKYIALLGLGATGAPLAHLLFQKYKNDFILLADDEHAHKLTQKEILINDELFNPRVVTKSCKLDKPIDMVFVCVKNYDINTACNLLKGVISTETIIIPLQNGVYAFEYINQVFSGNIILEGFIQGPNTIKTDVGFEYQNVGSYYIGTSNTEFKESASTIYNLIKDLGINITLVKDIKHAIWKKLILNVAGNTITALTNLDYNMFRNSVEAQRMCRLVLRECKEVASTQSILISEEDIEDIMNYFINYEQSKKTSMLEDVLHNRMTENAYIAGYLKGIADENQVKIPYTEMIYSLMKIKEDVYMGKLNS